MDAGLRLEMELTFANVAKSSCTFSLSRRERAGVRGNTLVVINIPFSC